MAQKKSWSDMTPTQKKVVVAAGIVSALIVRHRIDHLDLVAVLKTRE